MSENVGEEREKSCNTFVFLSVGTYGFAIATKDVLQRSRLRSAMSLHEFRELRAERSLQSDLLFQARLQLFLKKAFISPLWFHIRPLDLDVRQAP